MTRRSPASTNAGPANTETATAKEAASSSSLDGGTDNVAQQAGVDHSGRDRAEANADPFWMSTAQSGISTLAAGGRLFEAFDLVDRLGVVEPDSPARWGAAFACAARSGVITCVGAKPSRRPGSGGHLTRIWRGVRPADVGHDDDGGGDVGHHRVVVVGRHRLDGAQS